MLDFSLQPRDERGCRSVELRALCNEVPRTPPGPEGSNGIGIASGAADHPKFLALKKVYSRPFDNGRFGTGNSGRFVRCFLAELSFYFLSSRSPPFSFFSFLSSKRKSGRGTPSR